MNSLIAGIFSDVPSEGAPTENHHARPPGGAPGLGGEELNGGGWMPPSLLPQGFRWWPEHPLEALVIRKPTGKAVAGEPDAEQPAGRGGVGQARPRGGSVGRPARPQFLSRLASEDEVSCSDSSSLLGLGLVGAPFQGP